ncbi:venom allergen 3-like isoform X2 [Anthonomus grandis grandis]|uniref:venom allergen 3-like isoform X2 n=1 Tax=Anthonomus grandis grandis TaxID=2921223 RepID=UPI002165B723|nr:venom allergen 3-like isoform X2 [Anthonomus grandis grandis]
MHLRKNYLSFIIISLYFLLVSPTDYCKICKKGLSHTLCRYKEGPADACVEYKKPEISSSVKKYIVDIHNDIRNHVASGQETRGALGRQPSASNMNLLQWDNELGEIAQRWADQCIDLDEENQHDQCRTTERFELGQNVLTAVTSTLDVPEIAILILNWYKQVENVLPSDIETFSGIQRGKYLIGQYTQLIWGDTRFVGCGMSTFRNRNLTDPNAKYLHRLVCNYGPRGNLIGSSVYNRGIPCSKCFYGRCDTIRTSLCQALNDPEIFQWLHAVGESIKFERYFDGDMCNCLYRID